MAQHCEVKVLILVGFENDVELPVADLPLLIPSSLAVNRHLDILLTYHLPSGPHYVIVNS